MHPIFKILTSDIQSLDDEQARELVARLCRAELRRQGISESNVAWGGNQRAKDGGVDVDVAVPSSQPVTGFIPTRHTAFQVKAEKFAPSKLEPEMAPKGVLRPAILALQENHGTYIVVSTKDDPSHGALKDRLAEMRRVLRVHGVNAGVEFYGARVVADWAEQFPAIVTWIREMLGKPIHGWRSYGPWAYNEDSTDAAYLFDEEVRLFKYDGSEGVPALQAIEQLRLDLLSYRSIRIVGLSGVGKTRLVQALFDARIPTSSAVPSADTVVYADLSDGLDPQPRQMLEGLTKYDVPSILIVDNCGADLHGRLAEAKSKSKTKIGLVTIEYDVQDDLPDDTSAYRLEGSSDSIIKQILSRQFNVLSGNDIEVIAQFSDGNARVALALASTVHNTNELSQLKNMQLFDRLFFQGNGKNEELLKVGEVASLLYSFNGEDTSTESELASLASLAELSVSTFLRHVEALRGRGLVQSRSVWRAFLPHAIANRLAAQALSAMPTEQVVSRLFAEATDRTARSFSRRLGFLHESDRARKIVEEWFSPEGKLGHPELLNDLGKQVLMNVAPVHPAACLDALERAALSPAFIDHNNRFRRDFARLLKAIAYDEQYFDRAVETLCLIALADDVKGRNPHNVSDTLKRLFFCSLSGTMATPKQRARVMRLLLESSDSRRAKIGQILLDAALTTSFFSSDDGPRFGGRKRGFGWSPKSNVDVTEWFGTFIDLAVVIGNGDSLSTTACRTILGQHLRGLLVNARMWDECLRGAKELSAKRAWTAGWPALRAVRQYDLKALDATAVERLTEIEAILKPADLLQEIEVRLFSADPYLLDLDDASHSDDTTSVQVRMTRADERARVLGREAAGDPELLERCVVKLLHSDKFSSVTSHFGEGAGTATLQHRKIVDRCRDHFREHGTLGQAFQFLNGFVLSWWKSSPREAETWLDDCFGDETWRPIIVSLIDIFPAGPERAERIMRSLQVAKTPAQQYSYVAVRWNQSFSVEELFCLLENVHLLDHGLLAVLCNLNMIAFGAKENPADVNIEISKRILGFFSEGTLRDMLREVQSNNVHEVKSVFSYCLSHIQDFAAAKAILTSIIAYGDEARQGYWAREFVGVVIAAYAEHFSTETLDALWADVIAPAAKRLALLRRSSLDRKETLLQVVPASKFLAWCDVEPASRYAFAAMTCKLFESTTQEGDSDLDSVSDSMLRLSRLAVSVFRYSPDKQSVIEAFMERFFPNGWSGSLAAILRTRLQMLDELYDHADADAQVCLDQARARLQTAVEQAVKTEESEERARNESFE